jgi:hypothetical protein
MQALDEAARAMDVGQFLDRDAGLHAPDVGLAQHQLVEGDVARGTEHQLGSGLADDLV